MLRSQLVDGVVEQSLVVGAHVEQDGQAVVRGHATQRGVEGHFADGNAHAAGALVAESEDALAVTDHDATGLVVARVGEDLVDALAVGIADEEAARLAGQIVRRSAGNPRPRRGYRRPAAILQHARR